MPGIFYDPSHRKLHRVNDHPGAVWFLVTHDLSASSNRCRRIMREWLPTSDLAAIEWHIDPARRSA